MSVDAKLVKTLRERTGAGMMDCKKALVEANGDLDAAVDHLRKAGIAKAAKKSSRAANEGIIFSYIHPGSKLGVLVELGCETDFVAKTEGFNDLAASIAMQVAASNPLAVDESGVSQDILDKEKEIFMDQAKSSGKPENVVEKIVEGKLNKFIEDNCLVHQSFVKNPDMTISQLVQEAVAKLGENITINRFVRFALGEQSNQNMLNQSIDSAKSKMEQTISFVKSEIGKIRTGRANTEMFNNILVNYYDNETPLNQVANIAALDAITISIQPFDKTVIDDIEKAILESDLGFNPSNNGNSIMITFPPLSAERRQELVKVASKIIEDGRISVRNIRREIIQSAKRIEDEQNISEDNMKTFLDNIQEVTDSFITRLNALQKEKEVEILDK